ncbi:MAG: hypothetical protein LBQ48_04425 [Oscillospiraceae bacterium]|jgi:hypothetical protein|nr:hypothetical protein [Oscillospiraceae bacterium]
MGVESFYLNIQLQKENIDFIHELIKSNKLYNDFIGYYVDEESNELSLQAALVSFLPTCEVIYDLLKKVNKENSIQNIEALKINHPFDFENSLDFFCWMYNTWKKKLTYFNKDWGAFLVSPNTNYYKSRRRLRKKYYVKFSLND